MMKKLMTMVVVAMALAWGAWGAERITIDKVSNHYPWDGKVDCAYAVSGLDGGYAYKVAFALTVEKAGVSVRRVVTNILAAADGIYTNTFDCTALFGVGFYPNGGISVDLIKGDLPPVGMTGDVLVIDISGGSTAATYPTTELTDVDISTFNIDVYKTDKIVLRKIPAGTYYCQPGAGAWTTVSQKLTTKGFYIGVFPVTQRQYEQVMGTNPSLFKTDAAGNVAAQRPVESVSWNTIMASSADSFLKRLVAKTGLSGFDLPTEAQWEIACRANATAAYGAYWNGTTAVELTASTIGEAAWVPGNSSDTTHAVGGKRSNLWGLYDMQGNVWEWCRDIYIETYSTLYVDTPCTEASYDQGAYRVRRGGSWLGSDAEACRPSCRGARYMGYDDNYDGFRLSRALP